MIYTFINTHLHTVLLPFYFLLLSIPIYLNPPKSPCLPHPCWRLGAPERDPQVKKPRMFVFPTR